MKESTSLVTHTSTFYYSHKFANFLRYCISDLIFTTALVMSLPEPKNRVIVMS